MARGRYRPYGTSSGLNRRNRLTAIVLMILIAGMVILIQLRKKKAVTSETQSEEIPTVSLQEVVPVTSERAEEPAIEVPSVAVPTDSGSRMPSEGAGERGSAGSGERAIASAEAAASPEVRSLIEQAVEARKSGKIIGSRDLLNEALRNPMSEVLRDEVKRQLSLLSARWLFSKEVLEGDTLTEWYRVKPGDLLAKLSNEYKVPYEILMEINGIRKAESLQAGQVIKVIRGPFHAVINRRRYTLDLYLQSQYVKTYKVGLGMAGRETPTGLWRVKANDKLIQPAWTDPDTGRRYVASDPDYPLGSRWIGAGGRGQGSNGFCRSRHQRTGHDRDAILARVHSAVQRGCD